MLKTEYLDRLKEDKALLGVIAGIREVSFQTVQRWVEENHPSLMHILILQAIAKAYGVTEIKNLYHEQ